MANARTTHEPVAFIRTGDTRNVLSLLGYQHIPASHVLHERDVFGEAGRLLAEEGFLVVGTWEPNLTGWEVRITHVEATLPAAGSPAPRARRKPGSVPSVRMSRRVGS
ncbi:hypothetical protein Lfu02_05110 [Longispora fulva]|uniref:Uncharacterized protein n=1 Tax=Longispora fulva TaxID=619741 RepID=A0A8J7GFJ8_9ACTN|nr:hypothetical protein [Longispora fulva]MBG6135622.1 hypothetical protein [Longispora fulva]GIG56139.1 hypothetical protein Lfu02_05110 [Longispora fulva]